MFFVLIGVTIITFILSNLVSDPITATYGNRIKPEQREVIKKQLGLNDPLPVQYSRYVIKAVQGDLGRSYRTNSPVLESILNVMPNTIYLAAAGLLAELLIGIPAGIIAAIWRGSILDRIIQGITLAGLSLPTFWVGLVFLYVFAFLLKWFPLGGNTQPTSIILPALTIGLGGAVFYARLLRNQMLEEINSDYTRTARSKGLSGRKVITRHVLRNALLPIVTWAGLDLGAFLGGVVLVEAVYSWNGIGKLAIAAIGNLDIPLIMGTVLVAATFIVICNLFIDLLYPVLDPRIRLR
jgi:peptide/nickel transport system permease protein